MIALSIVVPVYSGQDYLHKLAMELDELRNRLASSGCPVALTEAIFVDDSAKDGSPAIIDQLAKDYPWIKALHLSRNFGQHPATIAGVMRSCGDWVVTMDEDLQHPPVRIPDLLEVVAKRGADIVYAAPEGQIHHSASRDWTSRTYKMLMEWLTGNAHIRKANSFRLMRGEIARAASAICAHDTYFDVALGWFTDRIDTAKMVLKDERYIATKTSGYNYKSLLSHARRLVASSQIKLLRTGALVGLVVLALSIVLSIGLILLKLLGNPGMIRSQGWTSLMLALAFFSGILMLMSGIILEYLSLLVLRAHGKPLYFIVDRSRDADLQNYFKPRDTAAGAPSGSRATV